MGMHPDRKSFGSIARLITVALISVWMLAVTVPSVSRLWSPLGTFGYHADSDGIVTQVSAMSPAKEAGLAPGDRFAKTSIPSEKRRYAIGPLFLAPAPGYSIRLPVVERSGIRTVTMSALAERLSFADDVLILIRTLGAVVFVLVGASLVLLRPSAMTWGLFFFTIGLNPGSDATFDAAIPGAWYPVNWALETLAIAAGDVGFLAFALRFPRDEIAGWRRPLSAIAPWLFAALGVLGLNAVLAPYVAGSPTETANRVFLVAGFAAFVCGLIALTRTYFQATAEDRQRIKWVIIGSAIALPLFALAAILDLTSVFPYPPYWVICALLSLNLLVPSAIAYAVVRHHVIDVTFVISRAVVYGILTALLVAAFALADWLLGRQLAGSGMAVAADVGITIAFAFWLNSIHRRIDTFVDSTLFRTRHLAERRIERLAGTLPHARAREAVSQLLVSEPVDALGLASAALFRRTKDDLFVRESDVGWPADCARIIDADDKLVLHLQSEQVPLDLHDLRWARSDLPRGAAQPQFAVPIAVRKQVLAFVLYGGHAEGLALDPDETKVLGSLMTGASAAYDHLDAEALRAEALVFQKESLDLAQRVERLETELQKMRESARSQRAES
jgi:hypothetical protein